MVRGAADDRSGLTPVPKSPPAPESKRLWVILGTAALAIVAALVLRSVWHGRAQHRAEVAAREALDRDTYGGFRDSDLALRPFVEADGSQPALAALRAYALAQLASRYADDQAAVESELLLLPLEQLSSPPPRSTAARALLLLARGEPGSALLALHWDPAEASSEDAAAQVRIQLALQRPDLAHQSLVAALAKGAPTLELLHAAADEARQTGRRTEARDFYNRALALNPHHIPSLIAVAELIADDATSSDLGSPVALQQDLPNLTSEASPSEHCQAVEVLTRLALKRSDIPAALALLERTAELEEAPASCLMHLARIDRRLGRPNQALALLKRAAHEDDPGEAPLALGEQLQDPRAALAELAVAPSRDASPAQAALWTVRANAARVRAHLMLGDRRAAEAAGSFLASDQGIRALLSLARLRALAGEHAYASRALVAALRLARSSPDRADDLVDVGEVALGLNSAALAAEACDEAAATVPGNCRALVCSARAFRALGRMEDARTRLSKALAINSDAPLPPTLRTDLGIPPTPAPPPRN